jgi:hypothetical protein
VKLEFLRDLIRTYWAHRQVRRSVGLALSVAVAIGLLAVLRHGHPARPPLRPVVVAAPHRRVLPKMLKPAAPRRVAVAPKPVKPVPSTFAQESAMSVAQRMARWDPIIALASRRFGVSVAWIRAVMLIESGGHTMLGENRPIRSSAGAMGLMQLMPKTYAEMQRTYGLGADPYDPHDNIFAGTAVLHTLYLQYGYPTMFAAYNDGPGMLQAHAQLGQALPAETNAYVRNIASILSTGAMLRHGGKADLAKLTRPDGSPVLIDAAAVVSIRLALPGEYAPSVRTVISIGRLRQGVREDLRTANAVIRSHGGI